MRVSVTPVRLFAALCLVAGALFSPVGAAQAHDSVGSTSPLSGDTVEAGVIDIVITFEEPVMDSPDLAGLEISVTGPDGAADERTDGCVDGIDGNSITETADIDAPGTYTVNWRSVSQDGHPVEGSYDFMVENTTDYVASEVINCAARTTAIEDKIAEDTDSEQPQYAFGISPLDGLIVGFVVIAIISTIGALNIRRREKQKEEKRRKKSND